MKKLAVRAVSLYVFNVAVLLTIGLLMRSVSVGLHALWASVILTSATLAVKPAMLRAFRGSAAKSAASRTKVGEKVVQYGLVFVVELIIWVLTVLLSGVNVSGWFWGYALPPVYLLIAWVIYDLVDDRIETKTGAVIGSVASKVSRADAAPSAPRTAPPQAKPERADLDDGLTPEQRRMLDEL